PIFLDLSGTLGRKLMARPMSAEMAHARSRCGQRPMPKPASAEGQPRSFRTWQESPSWRLDRVQWIGALRPWRRHSGSCASAASPRPVYFDDGRALGATQFLPLPLSSTRRFVVKWNEAFNHEDTSLGVVSASKAAEAEGSIPLWTTTLGRIRRNWPERLARDGVGSNRMRRRVQVRRRVVDWSTCLNARGVFATRARASIMPSAWMPHPFR